MDTGVGVVSFSIVGVGVLYTVGVGVCLFKRVYVGVGVGSAVGVGVGVKLISIVTICFPVGDEMPNSLLYAITDI